ncbi:MAG: hypothetical protein BWK80_00965 [Desulfobacteraceae bacterium IS3]|nr:MAG: hypothetical protein BWK80_00965 [Desulfobacteraceae bacterium IS3]
MSKIKILPENISNKIAAGEIVERPASVVKELIENSLDADSTRIIVEIEQGGRSLIRVADNGAGMGRDDALLAIERYATSKIFTDADLFSIKTLGFRGEALPSIAAVSRFTLETRDETSESGTRVIIEGGRLKDVSEIGAPKGTLINVSQLFFNMPARRKFLKSVSTEMSHIADTVTNIALSRPDVGFRLVHNEKTVRNWTPVSDPFNRVADILGRDTQSELYPVAFADESISISGWIASPRISRASSKGIYVYVNSRLVRDRIIQHALFEGYSGRLMKGHFPVAVLFLKLPADQVDVNVHPAKNEVRFAQQNRIHRAVAKAVSEALTHAEQPGCVRSPSLKFHFSTPLTKFPCGDSSFSLQEVKEVKDIERDIPIRTQAEYTAAEKEAAHTEQTPLWEKKSFGDLNIIGQFHGTYILCESAESLILIDQHAAHERIFFEKLKQQYQQGQKAGQSLLIPEIVELGYGEAEAIEKFLPYLEEAGFEIEAFGGNTVAVKSVPALLGQGEIKSLILQLAEKMTEFDSTSELEKAIAECLMLTACHGAVRANQQLSPEQIRTLLRQLDECENPFCCPHGRPVRINWTLRFIEKSFKRTE